MGAAMRLMASEPVPVPIKIGISPANITATVIAFGRTRKAAPSINAAYKSSLLLSLPAAYMLLSKQWLKIVTH